MIDFSKITISGTLNPEVRFDGTSSSYIVCEYDLKEDTENAMWWVLGFCHTANRSGGYIRFEEDLCYIFIEYMSKNNLPIGCPPMAYLEGCNIAKRSVVQEMMR